MKTDTRLLILIDHTFSGFTGVITHAGCWENTKKACKSLAFGSWFTSLRVFFIFLPRFRMYCSWFNHHVLSLSQWTRETFIKVLKTSRFAIVRKSLLHSKGCTRRKRIWGRSGARGRRIVSFCVQEGGEWTTIANPQWEDPGGVATGQTEPRIIATSVRRAS